MKHCPRKPLQQKEQNMLCGVDKVHVHKCHLIVIKTSQVIIASQTYLTYFTSNPLITSLPLSYEVPID